MNKVYQETNRLRRTRDMVKNGIGGGVQNDYNNCHYFGTND